MQEQVQHEVVAQQVDQAHDEDHIDNVEWLSSQPCRAVPLLLWQRAQWQVLDQAVGVEEGVERNIEYESEAQSVFHEGRYIKFVKMYSVTR